MKSSVPRSVADLLVSALPTLAGRLLEEEIRRAWPLVAGPDTARRSRPQRLLNGSLEVAVDNSPWLHELTLRAPELTERLSARFPAVRSVRFVVGVRPLEVAAPPPRAPRARTLSDEELRDIDAAVTVIPD